MYGPAINSIIEVRLMMEMNGQRLMNIFHYAPEESTSGDYEDGAQALEDLYNAIDTEGDYATTKYAVWASNQLKFISWELQFIYPTRYVFSQFPCVVTEGTQVGTAAPQNVAASCTTRSDFTGPHARGRVQLAGLTADAAEGGVVSAPVRAHMESFVDFMRGPFPIGSPTTLVGLVILNRAAPLTSQLVTSQLCQDTVRTMHRRSVRLGI